MTIAGQQDEKLRCLLEDALTQCTRLQQYTDDNYDIFSGSEAAKIVEALDNREKIIDCLVTIEYTMDQLYDEAPQFEKGRRLPPDLEALRMTVRAKLAVISAKDMEIAALISGKMQKYKNLTLKARNMKNLTAYMNSELDGLLGENIDFSK
jgi:hypothetical protein